MVFSILQGDVMDSVRIERVGAEWQDYHPDTESSRPSVGRAET